MAQPTLEIDKLTPHVGAEIHGVDLGRPLDDATVKALEGALAEHGVIFFRDQRLTPESQKALGRRFGELHLHPAAPFVLDGHTEVMVIQADERSTYVAGEDWHSDVSCEAEPPLGTILYMLELPPVGGDTLFAGMAAAWEALSDAMKRFLAGLTAVHDGEPYYRGRYGVDDRGKTYPRAEHPVVRTHPVTGRPTLFVNRSFTRRIVQLKPGESAGVLETLFRHIETPEFHCRFRWRRHSVAFWDNRAVQHQALWDYYPARRLGHRVTIKGDRPFYRP